MAKPWIGDAVVGKGKEGLRWLSSPGQKSSSLMPGADGSAGGYIVKFSENDGVLSLNMKHMRGKEYLLQVLEVDEKNPNTIWVGDGSMKIGAIFTEDPLKDAGRRVRVQNFDVVIDPKSKPDSRVTLHINSFAPLISMLPQPVKSGMEYVECESQVQKILNRLSRILDGQSPAPSQNSSAPSPAPTSEDFGTQADFSTQLPIEVAAGALPGLPKAADRNSRDRSQAPVEPPIRKKEVQKGPKTDIDLLKSWIPNPPRNKPAAPRTVAGQTFKTDSHTDIDVVDQEVTNQNALHLQAISENLTTSEENESSGPAQDLNHKPERLSAARIHGSSDDGEVLGDSEKENVQRENVTVKHPPVIQNDIQQAGPSKEPGIAGNDPDDPYKGLKKIPSRWLKIPRDQQLILDRADSWSTPGLPESVLQELRAPAHVPEAVEETGKQEVGDDRQASVLESDAAETDSESNEDEYESAAEQQQNELVAETISYRKTTFEAENIAERDFEPPDSSPAAEEPQEPQSSYSIRPSQDINRSDNIAPGSPAHSLASDEACSWEPTPEHEQQVHTEPNEAEFDEAMSEVPESSIPETSLSARKPTTSREHGESPRLVQVPVNKPTEVVDEEDEEEEEMELAEPSALGNLVASAEKVPAMLPIAPNNQIISTAVQSRAIVEVERTPWPRLQRQRLDLINADVPSSGVVIPATAEENTQLARTDAVPSAPRPQDDLDSGPNSQSDRQNTQTESNPSDHQSRTTSQQDSQTDAAAILVAQSDSQPSLSRGDNQSRTTSQNDSQESAAILVAQSDSQPSLTNGEIHTDASGSRIEPTLVEHTGEAEIPDSPPPLESKCSPTADKAKSVSSTQRPIDIDSLANPKGDNVGLEKAQSPDNSLDAGEDCEHTAEKIETSVQSRGGDLQISYDKGPQGSPRSGQQNIYERYRQVYPDFKEGLHSFIRACVYLEYLTPQYLKQFLWDDFVRKWCRDYPKYVAGCQKASIDPLPGVKWYNEQDEVTYHRGVLNLENLHQVLALNPEFTEKARKLFRKEPSKRSRMSTQQAIQAAADSSPRLEADTRATQPQASIPQTSVDTDDFEITGVASVLPTKKRSLPWVTSSQSDSQDVTPPSKRQKSDKSHSVNKQRSRTSLSGQESRNGEAFGASQPSSPFLKHLLDLKAAGEKALSATEAPRKRRDTIDRSRVELSSVSERETRNGETVRARQTPSSRFNPEDSKTSREKTVTTTNSNRQPINSNGDRENRDANRNSNGGLGKMRGIMHPQTHASISRQQQGQGSGHMRNNQIPRSRDPSAEPELRNRDKFRVQKSSSQAQQPKASGVAAAIINNRHKHRDDSMNEPRMPPERQRHRDWGRSVDVIENELLQISRRGGFPAEPKQMISEPRSIWRNEPVEPERPLNSNASKHQPKSKRPAEPETHRQQREPRNESSTPADHRKGSAKDIERKLRHSSSPEGRPVEFRSIWREEPAEPEKPRHHRDSINKPKTEPPVEPEKHRQRKDSMNDTRTPAKHRKDPAKDVERELQRSASPEGRTGEFRSIWRTSSAQNSSQEKTSTPRGGFAIKSVPAEKVQSPTVAKAKPRETATSHRGLAIKSVPAEKVQPPAIEKANPRETATSHRGRAIKSVPAEKVQSPAVAKAKPQETAASVPDEMVKNRAFGKTRGIARPIKPKRKSGVEYFAEKAKRHLSDPNRKRRVINLEEEEDEDEDE